MHMHTHTHMHTHIHTHTHTRQPELCEGGEMAAQKISSKILFYIKFCSELTFERVCVCECACSLSCARMVYWQWCSFSLSASLSHTHTHQPECNDGGELAAMPSLSLTHSHTHTCTHTRTHISPNCTRVENWWRYWRPNLQTHPKSAGKRRAKILAQRTPQCRSWALLVALCGMSRSYAWHDAFTCVTRLSHMCDMAY